MNLRHAIQSLCGLMGLLCLVSPAEAKPSIRVLLSQPVERVEVSAESALVVHSLRGDIKAAAQSIVFEPWSGGIRFNGKPIDRDRLMVLGVRQAVKVRLMGIPATEEREKGPDLPAATFTRVKRRPSRGPEKAPKAQDDPTLHEIVVSGNLLVLSRDGRLEVINELDLEEYVKGVVPAEMNAGWHLEALKAQAVATRTYALHQKMLHADREYDVVATVLDQVYRGRAGVNDRVTLAVRETTHLAITYEGRPILAAFSSTAAGPTEDVSNVWSHDLPYLKGVECPFDRKSPYYDWENAFPVDALEAKLNHGGQPVGTIATLTPYDHSRAGRVKRIRILHSEGELILKAEDFRRIVGYRVVPSTRFDVDAIGADIVMSGHGAGHAVGLCQWGTKELAELGYAFADILRYYYPGTEISRAWTLDPVVSSR